MTWLHGSIGVTVSGGKNKTKHMKLKTNNPVELEKCDQLFYCVITDFKQTHI